MAGESVSFTPGGVPQGARVIKFASTRLLHEWSLLQPWDAPPIYELRLGPTPLSASADMTDPKTLAMLRLFNRYADMVGITPTEIQVIEAKMILDPGAISQLEHYVNLVHYTDILRQFAPRTVQPVLLVAFSDPIVAQVAVSKGIRVLVYTPGWASLWLEKRYSGRKALQVEEAKSG
jgi:hypothetical protein